MRRLAILFLLAGVTLLAQTFEVTPASLSFGTVFVNNTATRTFTVTSGTFDPIGGYSFTINSTSGAFSVTPSVFNLNPNQSATVTVTFSPSSAGAFSGQIQVSGVANSQPIVPSGAVAVSGTATVPVSVAPSFLNMGSVLIGCSSSRSFQITPGGPLDFQVDSDARAFAVNPSRFSAQSPQTVTATFTPTGTGNDAATLRVRAFDRTTLIQELNVGATGIGVDFTASPASIDFGSIPAGVTSAARTVFFAVTPSTPLTLQISAASSNPAFQVSVTGQTSQIAFAPTADGTFTALITYTIFRQDQGFSPCAITKSVSVQGVASPLNVTADPSPLDFGKTVIGTTTAARTVTLTNNSGFNFTGTAAVDNTAYSFTPSTFALDNGKTQSFNVTFGPRAQGPLNGTLTFTLSSAAAGAATFRTTLAVPLTGEGVLPASLSLSPASLDFGDVSAGSSSLQTVVVTNTGGSTTSVSTSVGNASFTLAPSTFSLDAGASQTVNVTFSPSAAGAVQATATFTAGNSIQNLTLGGRGVVPVLSYTVTSGGSSQPVNPGGSVPFPATNLGAASGEIQLQIANSGSGAATVSSITSSNSAFALTLPPLPATVAPGANVAVRIVFRPSAPGPNTGTLSIDGRAFTVTGTGLIAAAAITGPDTTSPATQPTVGLILPSPTPVAVSGQLTLAFAPNAQAGVDDPALQFSSGGRTVSFTIPANSAAATFAGAPQIAFQSGTIAGTITLRATFQVSGVDVTAAPGPVRTIAIARSAPSIRSVTIANKTTTGFQVLITLVATSQEVGQARFVFSPNGSATLQGATATVDVGSSFTTWYRSSTATPFGSACTLTVPFTVSGGDTSTIRAVSVTLTNADGTSQPVEAIL